MIENYVLSGFFSVMHFHHVVFSSQLLIPSFLFQLFILHFCFQPLTPCVSAQLSYFKLNCPAFQLALVGKRGLILFTSGASSQQTPITPLPVYAGCCYMTVTPLCRNAVSVFCSPCYYIIYVSVYYISYIYLLLFPIIIKLC